MRCDVFPFNYSSRLSSDQFPNKITCIRVWKSSLAIIFTFLMKLLVPPLFFIHSPNILSSVRTRTLEYSILYFLWLSQRINLLWFCWIIDSFFEKYECKQNKLQTGIGTFRTMNSLINYGGVKAWIFLSFICLIF